MTFDDYAAIEAVNWTALKHLRESALAYRHWRVNKPGDTTALALGRITHALVFEPETFERDYAIWDGGRRAGKEWDAFRADHEGRTILKPDELDAAAAMADAVRRHPLVQPYLDGGLFEQILQWTDADTGLHCKARPDWLLPRSRVLLDLKTARTIDGRQFGNAAARYGYHCQLAHYAAGVGAALGWMPEAVKLVAVKKDPPHDVAVFHVADDALFAGSTEVRELLAKLQAHIASDSWPGRYTEEQALQLPAWLFLDDEEADADGLGLSIGE